MSKSHKIALSNGGALNVLDERLSSYYVIMMNPQLSDEVRQGANAKFNQRYAELQSEVKASLGNNPEAANMVNGKLYVAKGNSYQDDQVKVDAKNQGEFVTGTLPTPRLGEYQSAQNFVGQALSGAGNLIKENPLTAATLTATGLLGADQIAGRTLDGVKPTFDAQTDPDAPKIGKSRSFRVPQGGKGDRVLYPGNYMETNPGDLPNLTKGNYAKVVEAMPTTTPTADQLGLEGKSAEGKPLANALEAADPVAKQALNVQRFYNIESPLYEQAKQGKVTGARPKVDGNAIIESQQAQLPSSSWIKNRFKKIGNEEAQRIRANQPKNMTSALRPTEDPDAPKTKMPKGTKVGGLLAAPALTAIGYNTLVTDQANRRNLEQYEFVKNILENNGVDTATGQTLYTAEDIEEAMNMIKILQDAGAIGME